MAFPGAHAHSWNFRPGTRTQARAYLEHLAGQEPRDPHLFDEVSWARGTAVRAATAAVPLDAVTEEGEGAEEARDEEDFAASPSNMLEDIEPKKMNYSIYNNTWAGSRDYDEPADEAPEEEEDDKPPAPGGALAALRARVAKLAGVEPPPEPRPSAAGAAASASATEQTQRREPAAAAAASNALGAAPRPAARETTALATATRAVAPAGAAATAGGAGISPVAQQQEKPGKDLLSVLNTWTDDEHQLRKHAGQVQLADPAERRKHTPVEKMAQEMREAVVSSPLLARMRVQLAEDRVDRAPPEYASFCQHLKDEGGDMRRLNVAEVLDVCKARKVPSALEEPVVIEARSSWRPRRWSMAFWSYECGDEICRCFRRYPPIPDDGAAEAAAAAASLDVRVDDFAKYVGVVRDLEPSCSTEKYLVFPRFFVGGWSPFMVAGSEARRLWEDDLRSGRQLWAPPGVKDMTDRWVKMFCSSMNQDWKETLAGMDRVQLGPAGAVTRLHVENAAAHSWHGQIQGRRAFVLFSPREGANLYAEGGHCESQDRGQLEERVRSSPVDVLRPGKSLPKFREARARVAVLEPGEILVVPQGWWLYSVTLEPSATLCRRFWNSTNRDGICEELEAMFRERFERAEGELQARERLRAYVDKLRYKQQQDYSSDED